MQEQGMINVQVVELPAAFSAEHVQRCRAVWGTPDFALLFVTFCQSCQFPDVHMRLKMEDFGGVQLCMDVIRDGRDQALTGRAWVALQNFVLVNRVDDPLEMKPIDVFVARGGVELACIELNLPEPRWAQTVLTALAWTSTNEKVVPRVIASGVHMLGIHFIKSQHPQFMDISMSFIRSASAAPSCRAALRADGALEAFLPFILCNKSDEPFQMRRGFRAASVVARLAGNDETGIGPQTLRNNPSLISTTLSIFSQVLDAGPHGTVINMLVNPHFITMDLLIISTADVNKPLLVNAIPICMSALRLRGEVNPPMTSDIIRMFLQLSFDATCRKELNKIGPELVDLLKQLLPPPSQIPPGKPQHDKETYMASQMLQQALSAPTAPASPAASPVSAGLQGFVRRIVGSYSSAGSEVAQQHSPLVEIKLPQLPQQHVMLSYFWSSSETVKKLDEQLRNSNVNVWVDYRDMGPNQTESLQHALNKAAMMVVLVSARYKQSATCRKELEAAELHGIPIVYILVEQNYKPDGWLGCSVGLNLMLEGWHPDLLRQRCAPKIIERASALGAGAVSKSVYASSKLTRTNSNASRENSSTPPPAYDKSNGLPPYGELVEAFSTLSATVNEMRRELVALRREVIELRQNQNQDSEEEEETGMAQCH